MEEKELGRDIFPKTPAEENEGPKIYLEEGDTESNTDNRFNELLNSDAYKKDNGYEYGRIEPFDYHEVYSDGEYIYMIHVIVMNLFLRVTILEVLEKLIQMDLMYLKKIWSHNMNKEYETIIGKMLKEYVPIEWMRYKMFHVDDVYSSIPMLVFRLEQKDDKFDMLLKCIDNFNGNARWEIFRNPYTRKENYLLTVSEVKQMYQEEKEKLMYQKDFFGDEYIEICDKALSDIPRLASHIEKWFNSSEET